MSLRRCNIGWGFQCSSGTPLPKDLQSTLSPGDGNIVNTVKMAWYWCRTIFFVWLSLGTQSTKISIANLISCLRNNSYISSSQSSLTFGCDNSPGVHRHVTGDLGASRCVMLSGRYGGRASIVSLVTPHKFFSWNSHLFQEYCKAFRQSLRINVIFNLEVMNSRFNLDFIVNRVIVTGAQPVLTWERIM